MSKLIRYLLVTAALYGPFVYAADPVVVNQSDRKTMYGTAAVRPTPEAFDLASRGMCYVATDTGTVTEWTGTAWITTATCPGSATTSTNNSAGQYADDADFTDGTSVGVLSQGVAESASPTAVTEGDVGAFAMTLNRALKSSLYTPNGDSAMDDTNDAVRANIVTGTVTASGTMTAVGSAADGAAVSGNPNRIAGKDPSGNTQDILTDTSGRALVLERLEYEDIAASQTDQALGATGGAGDVFSGYTCVQTASTTLAADVTVEDGSGTAFVLIPSGASAGTIAVVYTQTNLNWTSTSGAWEFTTPANIACKAWGDFT